MEAEWTTHPRCAGSSWPSCDSSDTTFFGVHLPATLDALEQTWRTWVADFPFAYTFLDAQFAAMYRAEQAVPRGPACPLHRDEGPVEETREAMESTGEQIEDSAEDACEEMKEGVDAEDTDC